MSAHLGPAATAFVDGQLDHRRRDEVLAHLTHCPACRADVDAVRRLKASLQVAGVPPLSSDLSVRLLAACQGPAPAPRRRRRPRIRRTAVGGALLAIGIGGSLSLAGPPPSGPPAKVDPASITFVLDHADSAGEVPFTEPDIAFVANVGTVFFESTGMVR